MAGPLPPDTIAGEVVTHCPWCREDTGDASVTIDALLAAWEKGELESPSRCDDGTADPSALTAECSACGHPFIVALQDTRRHGKSLRLVPVRTSTDARLLAVARPTQVGV